MVNPLLILLWVAMEVFLLTLFFQLNKKVFITKNKNSASILHRKDVIKGLLERLLLIGGLVNGYPEVITAFAALKIGTRINDRKHKVSNDYFLMGNIISLLAALIVVITYQKFLL